MGKTSEILAEPAVADGALCGKFSVVQHKGCKDMDQSSAGASVSTDIAQVNVVNLEPARNITMLIYILYAVGFVTGGLTGLVGVIIAHVKRRDTSGTIYHSHLTWLIRTFWISFAIILVGGVTAIFGVGAIILVADGVWVIYRVVKGFLKFNDGQAIESPNSFI